MLQFIRWMLFWIRPSGIKSKRRCPIAEMIKETTLQVLQNDLLVAFNMLRSQIAVKFGFWNAPEFLFLKFIHKAHAV